MTTIGLLKALFSIPKFTIEKKDFLDKVLPIAAHKDIDYSFYHNTPKDYIVKVENVQKMDAFLSKKLKVLIEISALHHMEINGESILIYSHIYTLAQVKDYINMIQFANNFKSLFKKETLK